MANKLLMGLSSLLLPLGLYGSPAQSSASYQRSYFGASMNTTAALDIPTSAAKIVRDVAVADAGELQLLAATAVHELVIIDAAVPDKQQFYRAVKPGVDIVEIDSSKAGLVQLKNILANYKNLAAVHIVSHAQAGSLQLGNSTISAETLKSEVETFAALNGAVREGGDLLLYGCDLAANDEGEELLDIIQHNTHLDVAASDDLTGNLEQGADWNLEIQRGNIDTELAFSEKALKDFSAVLATYTLSNFTMNYGVNQHCPDDSPSFTYNYQSLTKDSYIVCGFMGNNSTGGTTVHISNYYGNNTDAFLSPNGSATNNQTLSGTNSFEVRRNNGNFQLSSVVAAESFGGTNVFTSVKVVGYVWGGGTVESTPITSDTSAANTFTFSGANMSAFAGVNLTSFRLVFVNQPNSHIGYLNLKSFDATQDVTPPTVTSVNSSTANGTYKAGDVISIQVSFSEPVNVTATPQLTLETGATDRVVSYSSGSGSSTLTFNYTVQAGDNTLDLDYLSTNALSVNLAGIRDGASNNAVLTLPAPGSANSLAGNKSINIDGVAPTVSSVSASTANATYKVGDVINVQVNFSEVVNVTGSPQLTLETGTTDRAVNYTSGSGSSTLNFSYTVQAGDNNSDLDYVSTSALALNGGTIRDAASNNATLTLASPGAANSLGANKALVVDGVTPSVTSTAPSGGAVSTDTSVDFTVNFSESVNNISTDDFALGTTGGATGTIASVSATSGSSVTVTVSGITGNGTIKLNLNGATNISDAAGNVGPAAYTSGSAHTVAIPTAPDAPTIGTATAGDGQVSVAFSAPGNNGGSAITGYTVTSNPGGFTNTGASSPILITGLTNGTAYTFTVTATNGIGTGTASAASNSATPKADQTITFAQPSNYNFGTTPNLSATSDSGLTVTFSSSTTGVCTVSGVALTFVSAGTCTIDADQAGNSSTNAATTVTQSFTVNAIVPGAPTIGTATAGDTEATVTFTAPASTGGASILAGGYTVTASPGGATGTGSSSPITVTGLTNGVSYTFTVTATNSAGTGAASAASNSITPASPQTITFANPGAQNFGTSPTLSATSTSGLTVSFTSSTPGVCTVSSATLTFLAAGTCTINADQAGDSSFLPASQVSRSFTVNAVVPGAPTIGTAIAGDTQASVAFVAPVNIGGSAITGYTVTVNPADVAPVMGASSPIVVTGLTNGVAYTFTVTADNVAGTGPASGASNSITPAATQTITFANPGAQNFGTTPTLSATSDSGLTPTFTSSTTGVCTITTGGALTFVTAGTCTINADQAGNGSYLAATQVTRSFTVNAVVPGAPTIGTATAGNTQATVAFTAPASNGGSPVTGYTVTASPGGATATGAGSPVTFTGLTNGTSYTFSVTATNSAGTGAASAASNAVIPKGTQTINFPAPGNQVLGTPLTVTASASSGLTPEFSSTTNAVCTVTSGGVVTLVAIGTCTLRADQDGNTSYLAAPSVSRSFTVNPAVPGAPTAAIAVAGDTSASVSFNAPASNGGAAITSYTVTASPGGITATGAGSPINVTGLTNGTAYSFRVSASNTAGAGAQSAVSNTVTPIGGQTISFTDPGNQPLGVALTVTATASSGLVPVFTSSTLSICTVTPEGVVTLLVEGTCTLNADEAGNAAFNPAPTVSHSFTVLPPPNQPPVISQGSAVGVTMSEDGVPTAFALMLDATDSDSDPLSWTLTGPAQQGAASVSATGSVSYEPTADYHGSDSFVVQVSDGEDTASITVSVTIESVNDLPVISGAPALTVDQDMAYSFTPTATDVDAADVLTFSIINKPTWASFNSTTGTLTGTPANVDAGISGGIVISVSDGTATVALPAFEIEVIATIDPLQPIVTPPADLELNATALFTPVSLRQLLGLAGNATQAQIEQLLNTMASDGVSGNSCCTTNPEGLGVSNVLQLSPGRHEVKWKATNAVGVTGEAIQVINIKPLVSLSKSQVAVRGSTVEFKVLLNGPSPVYPFSVPYVINATETTATAQEHNLVNGVAAFTQAGQVEVAVPVTLPAVTGLSDSVLVVALGSGINAGAARQHVIEIRQGNIPPVVSLNITQGGINTSLVSPSAGPVTVTANVVDANKSDTHTFDWSATTGLADIDGSPANASRTFDPIGLAGSQQLKVTVTDSGGASVQSTAYFRVVSTLPVLNPNTDTDQDGINDELEGTGDTDDNGIPDYQDNMPSTNILPQQGNTTNAFLIECDPGVRCGLGLFARSGGSGGVQILDQEIGTLDDLIVDPAFEPVGGVFDFAIRDLPTPGQSVRVVIPQRSAIPVNAVYRKYQRGAWVTFVSDADNAVHSAAGSPGYCPPPGSTDWTSGLTAGHMCVQLTIEDGGPNDDDGLVNSAVVDPGAVSEAKAVEPPPKPPVQVNSKGGGAVPALWLLLLGGLVILKRATRARLAAIALAVFSINTQALENTYVRLDVFTVNSSHSEADFTGALQGAGHEFTLNSYDDSRTGFQIAAGYQWSELTYSEVGYLDLGDVEVNLSLDGDADLDAFAGDFAKQYPITATGVTLVQGLSFKTGPAFTFSAEAGAFIWRGKVELDNAAFALEEDDGIDPLVGLKIDLALSDSLSLGLSGRRIFIDDQDIDLYALSSSFRF